MYAPERVGVMLMLYMPGEMAVMLPVSFPCACTATAASADVCDVVCC